MLSPTLHLAMGQVWYWMAWHNCMAIFKVATSDIHREFLATGALQSKHKGLLRRLMTVWFHVVFVLTCLGVVAWKLATMDYRDCVKVRGIVGWRVMPSEVE